MTPQASTNAAARQTSTGFARIGVARRRGKSGRACSRKRATRDFRTAVEPWKFALDEARRVLTAGQRRLRPAPAEAIVEPSFFSQCAARLEAFRKVAATRIAICRASVLSDAQIWSGVTAGPAPEGFASRVRSAPVF